jgi:hypothetical protein
MVSLKIGCAHPNDSTLDVTSAFPLMTMNARAGWLAAMRRPSFSPIIPWQEQIGDQAMLFGIRTGFEKFFSGRRSANCATDSSETGTIEPRISGWSSTGYT